MTTPYDVILGLDVGKTAHHGCAMSSDGANLYDQELPQDETALRALIEQLQKHGQVLVVVDQPNTIGAFVNDGGILTPFRRLKIDPLGVVILGGWWLCR